MARTDGEGASLELQARPRSGRLVDRVVEQLEQLIRDGDFQADSRLPSEHDLAARLGVSRPVVREAIDHLRKRGVVYSRQGAGTFLQSNPAGGSVLSFTPIQTIADIQRCYEFRLTIEPDAAHLAAQRRDEVAIQRISAALGELREATSRKLHRTESDFAFHRSVAEAANNHYYTASMDALRPHMAVGMHLHGLSLLGPQLQLENVYAEHKRIFDAIAEGRAAEARDSMRSHLQGSRDRLFEGRLLDLALSRGG
jgi:GntR family transcriptional repressor for pyruvate dehydrogenase complex